MALFERHRYFLKNVSSFLWTSLGCASCLVSVLAFVCLTFLCLGVLAKPQGKANPQQGFLTSAPTAKEARLPTAFLIDFDKEGCDGTEAVHFLASDGTEVMRCTTEVMRCITYADAPPFIAYAEELIDGAPILLLQYGEGAATFSRQEAAMTLGQGPLDASIWDPK